MLDKFNSSGVGVSNGNYFSLPCEVENSGVVLVSAPWDATVSYGNGTAKAPAELIKASTQLDLYDSFAHNAWYDGIATVPIDGEIEALSRSVRPLAERVIDHLENGGESDDAAIADDVVAVNKASERVNEIIFDTVNDLLIKRKLVGLVGGEHSVSYGAIKAMAEYYDSFGVLHIDAHRDLRVAYEGFEYSHASVMYNVLRDIDSVSKLVQVGVRDFCDEEQKYAYQSDRVVSFEDMDMARNMFEGETWSTQCCRIVESLPKDVYISFDIDGLQISYCPHTGTPVSGGMSFNQAVYLLELVVRSGRRIIGFDMVEVVPSESDKTDLVTGARILYKMCGLAIKSNKDKL